MPKKEFFSPGLDISRDDLIAIGVPKWHANEISDEQMERIARKLPNEYLMQAWWDALGSAYEQVVEEAE